MFFDMNDSNLISLDVDSSSIDIDIEDLLESNKLHQGIYFNFSSFEIV